MSKVMLVQPWNYHDEGIKEHDLAHEWRNGPYSLLLLATQLRKHNHEVVVVDMTRDLVVLKGNVEVTLNKFSKSIRQFMPDIIGFGFFSIHYFEVRRAIEVAKQTCTKIGIQPLFIAGGIHASIEPKGTIKDLGFDYSFVGEADLGILQLADGQKPETISGILGPKMVEYDRGEGISPLDSLPFPDWSLCDYQFYAHPSFAKLKFKKARILDVIMGRGCVHRCAFCAYNALSRVRYYSAEYIVEQIEYMKKTYNIDGIYFIDSSIGNNQRLIHEFCELMIQRGISKRIEWYGNMRANQVNEELLKLMWHAGCRYLFYGFESGSQRVLKLMAKGVKVEANYKAAELHNKLKFPYNASMLFGYPGERDEDILQSFEFLRKTKPPSIGINWYVPLPGSSDYNKLKAEGKISTNDPREWRRIGEVNSSRIYSDISEIRFRELSTQAERLAYVDIPMTLYSTWGFKAFSQRNSSIENKSRLSLSNFATFGLKLLRSVYDSLSRKEIIMPFMNKFKQLQFIKFWQGSDDKYSKYDATKWETPFTLLRKKWKKVPAANDRISTERLLLLPDKELLELWQNIREEATTGPAFGVRGWYHLIYKNILCNKQVMDVGSGLGIDGITFAQYGARITFVDVVESNILLLKRLCKLLGLTNLDFCYMEDIGSLSALPTDYDVIWCQGSLINAPFNVIRQEAQELLKHLPVAGRWIELAYPKIRWERDGKLPFHRWGEKTDGGAPWIEWYDLEKIMNRLCPAKFDVVLHFNFCNDEFNWFDLIRRQ